MKNIFLVPTKSKSNLYEGNLGQPLTETYASANLRKPIGLYITSGKKAKKGDYAVATQGLWRNIVTKITGNPVMDVWEEIILTNDEKLIKDGIQSVPNDFLNWFVENSSCEFVEVEKKMIQHTRGKMIYSLGYEYKIILPKLPLKCTCERPNDNTCDYCDMQESKQILEDARERAKQQKTITDIAEILVKEHPDFKSEGFSEYQNGKFNGIIEGIEYQQKKSYSESEVLTILEDYDRTFKLDTFAYTQPCKYTVKEWFDKNKKQH